MAGAFLEYTSSTLSCGQNVFKRLTALQKIPLENISGFFCHLWKRMTEMINKMSNSGLSIGEKNQYVLLFCLQSVVMNSYSNGKDQYLHNKTRQN